MENTEIKACPFCGSTKVELTYYNKPCIVCLTCWAGGPSAHNLTEYDVRDKAGLEAKHLWNQRAGDRQPMMPETVGVKALASATLLAGVELIKAERQRQVSVEGWTPEHDDGHKNETADTFMRQIEKLHKQLMSIHLPGCPASLGKPVCTCGPRRAA